MDRSVVILNDRPRRIHGKAYLHLGQGDTQKSGLDSLATNARNTLQHAESWEESEVASTMVELPGVSASRVRILTAW